MNKTSVLHREQIDRECRTLHNIAQSSSIYQIIQHACTIRLHSFFYLTLENTFDIYVMIVPDLHIKSEKYTFDLYFFLYITAISIRSNSVVSMS